ncbi:hypothetical protein BDZ45DRAFT_735784 [Acephala macrosclerotiorum]|nr:hypothetical protein BDZ45DRAFT_735784 [Acephala macrosclerotiorum]
MAASSDQEFIEQRVSGIEEVIRTQVVESLLPHYVDEGLDYSDYARAINMNKSGLRSYVHNFFQQQQPKSQYHIHFTPDKADGREIKMVGVSIAWWNEEGKMYKNHEYTKAIESFEGR